MTVGKSIYSGKMWTERTDGKLKKLLADDPGGEQVAYRSSVGGSGSG